MVIVRHLTFDGQAYRIELAAAETKAGRSYHATVPSELTPYIDRYLRVHRPALQSIARPGEDGTRGRLWIGRLGTPMSRGAIRRQIEERPEEAFGKAIWPHLFRDCPVTELGDSAPDEIGIAPGLLGHADLQMTTTKHYIHAEGTIAHARIWAMIAADGAPRSRMRRQSCAKLAAL